MHADRRLLGWGLFFILLGGIPLLTKTGLLDAGLVRGWPQLWPVLLIGWGLGLLLRGTPLAVIGGVVSAVTFGVMGGGALATGFGGVPFASGCGDAAARTAFTTRQGDLGATAQAAIEFNCGRLNVSTADGSGWSVAGADRDGRGPTVAAVEGAISLKSGGSGNVFGSSGAAEWTVTLPRAPLLAVAITLNAGRGAVDLDGAAISSLSMTVNGGSINLDMAGAAQAGDVDAIVNAGSAQIALPSGGRAVDLALNAGALEVCLPAGTPIRVTWSGALGSNNLDAVGLVRGEGQTWTSPGFGATLPHVELHATANAGSFELHLGGVCAG
jgi:hypothetical protein